jgi:S-adenosylmethionine-diacylgycerolhomoserine-N-methlytransferase
MTKARITSSVAEQNRTIATYYQFQSRIYDLTRWSFLFGRNKVVDALPFPLLADFSVLEVGCGTGYNLRRLARRYPNAQLSGMDLSTDMLEIAEKNTRVFQDRITLRQAPYGDDPIPTRPDVILFSYALTMINPQWEQLIHQAYHDLAPGGFIAVADFHDSQFSWFRRHMSNHHVRMDGHLLPVLQDLFTPDQQLIKSAYLNTWRYFIFIGKK